MGLLWAWLKVSICVSLSLAKSHELEPARTNQIAPYNLPAVQVHDNICTLSGRKRWLIFKKAQTIDLKINC